MTTPPMSRRDLATGSGRVTGSVGAAVPSWTHSWNTQKPAATPKPRGNTTRAFTPWSAPRNWQTLALLRNPEDSPLRNLGRLIFLPPLLSPDAVRVASSIAAAARGDAAQAAFDRKLSHYRIEFGELRQQGIQYLPLVWTADWRPHLAVKRFSMQQTSPLAGMGSRPLGRRTGDRTQP